MDIKHYPPTELRAPDLFAPRNCLHLARSLFLCLSTCASSSLMADELSMFIALASKASTQSDLPSQFKPTTATSPVTQVQSRPMAAATTVVPVQFKPATAASSDTQVQSSSQAATPTVVPVQFKSVAATSQVTQVQSRPLVATTAVAPVQFKPVAAVAPVTPVELKPVTAVSPYPSPATTVSRPSRPVTNTLQFSKEAEPATATFAPARLSESAPSTKQASSNGVSALKPVVAPAAATAVSGVSALAFNGVPARLAGRQGIVAGPSEQELKEMFYRAVQAAAERSPKVQRAHAELAAADSDIDEAKGQRYPQVDLGTQAGSKRFGSGAQDTEGNSTGITLNVVTPVYDWGRIRNTIDSRRHLSVAATAAIDAELESSAFDVTSTMTELGKQRIIVDLSQQYIDRMNELVKMLAGIVAVDKGRSSELTQAKARLLQAQAARDSASTRAQDAEINLRKLVGERPIMVPRTKEWNIRLANLDHLLAQTENHPAINQAKAQTESAELQAKVVRSSSLPQLNWVVSKSTAEDSVGREQPWETHLAVTWGAFRGGSTRASERAALQRAEASRQEVEQQRLDLQYRIRTANHDARTFLERAELYRDLTVESDGIRLAFYEQWYHLGKRTLLDVLSAESDHYGNRVSEVTNRFDGYLAVLRQYAGAGTLGQWLSGAQH